MQLGAQVIDLTISLSEITNILPMCVHIPGVDSLFIVPLLDSLLVVLALDGIKLMPSCFRKKKRNIQKSI